MNHYLLLLLVIVIWKAQLQQYIKALSSEGLARNSDDILQLFTNNKGSLQIFMPNQISEIPN